MYDRKVGGKPATVTRFFALRLNNQGVEDISKLQLLLAKQLNDGNVTEVNPHDFHVTMLHMKQMNSEQDNTAAQMIDDIEKQSDIVVALSHVRVLGQSIVLEFKNDEVDQLRDSLVTLRNERLPTVQTSGLDQKTGKPTQSFISHISLLEFNEKPHDIARYEKVLNKALRAELPCQVTLNKIEYLEHIASMQSPAIVYQAIQSRPLIEDE
ncbi:hypothetical protein [Legionella sp. W05-934-2]|jgi:2'-5' RNA ligase|uniref:hypothetical protein n=1 Tax=Legionella sp. W05-934-2 TaxID=1198649 RepID=UPI0034619133